MNKDFYELLKMCGLYFLRIFGLSLTRKIQLLKNSIKTWKKQYDTNPDNTMHKLASDLDIIQSKLMVDPHTIELRMQKQVVQEEIGSFLVIKKPDVSKLW